MEFLDLALEILHHILQFCSPHDLASLSRTHSSLRDVAEYVLYSNIACHLRDSHEFSSDPREPGTLLHTLVTSARKALLVKTLDIQPERPPSGTKVDIYHRYLSARVARALRYLPNLADLRIVTYDHEHWGVSQVIRSHTFRLHTLFLEDFHDLEGIIADQPELCLLGIYHFYFGMTVVKRIEDLYHRTMPLRHSATAMPTIFMVHYLRSRRTVTMLPAFYGHGQIIKACEEAVSSMAIQDFYRDEIKLYLGLPGISKENIGLFEEAIEAMATCMSNFQSYLMIVADTTMQTPWRFPELVRPVTLLKNIRSLHFLFPHLRSAQVVPLSKDIQSSLVQELGQVWSNVLKVIVSNDTVGGIELNRPHWRFQVM